MPTLAVCQFSPKYKNLPENCDFVLSQSEKINADIIVFPELALSGYFFTDKNDILPLSLSSNDIFIHKLVQVAYKQKKIIVCGFAEQDGGTLYNSAVAALPDGSKAIYRKTHLFYKEHLVFSPGNSGFFSLHVPHFDLSLGMMICYDWRFPEAARTLALRGADLICCPSNLVTDLWHKVMPARAIENKVYLAVANRCGTENLDGEELIFKGESAIWSYNGNCLAKAEPTGDAVVYAEIDATNVRKKSFNSVNDIFLDRRPDMYE